MTEPIQVHPASPNDYDAWRPLWEGDNTFYGRHGETALPEPVTKTTWQRLLDPDEPMFALLAVREEAKGGLAHYLFHRSMSRIENICYLGDLFTTPDLRGQGIGRALI